MQLQSNRNVTRVGSIPTLSAMNVTCSGIDGELVGSGARSFAEGVLSLTCPRRPARGDVGPAHDLHLRGQDDVDHLSH